MGFRAIRVDYPWLFYGRFEEKSRAIVDNGRVSGKMRESKGRTNETTKRQKIASHLTR